MARFLSAGFADSFGPGTNAQSSTAHEYIVVRAAHPLGVFARIEVPGHLERLGVRRSPDTDLQLYRDVGNGAALRLRAAGGIGEAAIVSGEPIGRGRAGGSHVLSPLERRVARVYVVGRALCRPLPGGRDAYIRSLKWVANPTQTPNPFECHFGGWGGPCRVVSLNPTQYYPSVFG